MRTITFDVDTGQVVPRANDVGSITGEDGARIAAAVLPGATPELVDEWYSAWIENDTDPTQNVPFATGRDVQLVEMPALKGRVTRRVLSDGELTTLWVLWDGSASAIAYGPRELKEIQ